MKTDEWLRRFGAQDEIKEDVLRLLEDEREWKANEGCVQDNGLA